MRRTPSLALPTMALFVFMLPAASICLAEDKPAEKPKLGWGDSAELAYVVTSGNSELSTLGFKNTLTRTWENALLEVKAGGIRAESTTVTHVVSSPGPPVDIREDESTDPTGESYFLNGKYSRDITKAFYWFGFA